MRVSYVYDMPLIMAFFNLMRMRRKLETCGIIERKFSGCLEALFVKV